MKKIFFILLALFAASAHAEVFKCLLKSGKTVYQSTPCESAVKQEAIEIQKADPRKIAEEEAKLKAWEDDFAKREAARVKAEKEHQAELNQKASVEALKKSAEYQQQQAYEAKRQADALEQRNMQAPYQAYPNYPIYQPFPAYPAYTPYQQHNDKTFHGQQQSDQNETKTRKYDDDDDSGGAKIIFKLK